jgi:hypothetical protein
MLHAAGPLAFGDKPTREAVMDAFVQFKREVLWKWSQSANLAVPKRSFGRIRWACELARDLAPS